MKHTFSSPISRNDKQRSQRVLRIAFASFAPLVVAATSALAQPALSTHAASSVTRTDGALVQVLRPDLAITNTSAAFAGGTLRLTTCVKNVGVGRSRASVLQVAFGGQWREPPPIGLAVGAPYAFERQIQTKALNAGEEQCHTINSGIAEDETYRKSCRDVLVRADLTQSSGETHRTNNEAKWSDCNRAWAMPRQSVTPLTTKPSSGAQPE